MRLAAGMLIIQQEAVGRAANAASVHVFSDDLAGVVDPILLRPRDRGTVFRLQSAGEFAYAAVDLTQTYRSDRAYYDNAEVASVVREFLYIRNLEALVISGVLLPLVLGLVGFTLHIVQWSW